jgi:SAM-dependent methyltransferase
MPKGAGGMLKSLFKKLLLLPWRLLPSSFNERLLPAIMAQEAARRGPRQGLRFLLSLDNQLYGITGDQAVANEGGGQHPRHRLIGYHDFFTQRLGPGERVLDVGCGVGLLALALAAKAQVSVVGVDDNPRLIAMARERAAHPNVEYLAADARAPLPRKGFDAIVLSNILEHLPDRPQFLRDLVAIHSPQRLLIRVPSSERDWRVPLKRELGLEWRLDPTHLIEHTPQQLRDELEQAGLAVMEMQTRWGELWVEARPRTPTGDQG